MLAETLSRYGLPDSTFIPLVRHVCRVVSYNDALGAGATLPQDQRKIYVMVLKQLNGSAVKNTIYSAVWQFLQTKRYAPSAQRFGLSVAELKQYRTCLTGEDIATIVQRLEPKRYSDVGVMEIINAVKKWNRYLVRSRLYFYWHNDYSVDAEDLASELECRAIRIIRHYEIYGYDTKYMASLVAKGMDNHTQNLTRFFGNGSRNPLVSMMVRENAKTVWYLDRRVSTIRKATVYPDDLQQRKAKGIVAHFDDHEAGFVNVYLLYATEVEAEAALNAWNKKRWRMNKRVIDLTPNIVGDWTPAVMYMEAKNEHTGAKLSDCIASEPIKTEHRITFNSKHNIVDPRINRFIETLNGDWEPLFDQHCVKQYGRPACELTYRKLITAAQRFCNVTTQELRAALLPIYKEYQT